MHWVLYNIPPTTLSLAEGLTPAALPPGTLAGITDYRRRTWNGPCPPIGRHRYFFKLYALDTTLAVLPQGTKAELERAMTGHVLARAELMGTYEKRR